MADKVNFAGYTRPARLPSGKVSAARLRRAAAANRQPRAESPYQIWNGLVINSAQQGNFEALCVHGLADYALPLILMGVDSGTVPYFWLYQGSDGSRIFGADATACYCDRAFNFNIKPVDPSLKDYDARFDGQHTTHVLFVDASKDSVAIGTGTCQTGFRLTVSGSQYLSGQVTASNFESTLATEAGAPFACNSTAVCTNLNADLLDGYHSSSFLMAKGATTQIPYMNAGGTDFLYSANLVFDGTTLTTVTCVATTFGAPGVVDIGGYGNTRINYEQGDYDTLIYGDAGLILSVDAGLNTVKIEGAYQLQFRDTAIHIASGADGHLDLTADVSIDFNIGAAEQISLKDGVLEPTATNDVDLGSSSSLFKNAYFEGNVYIDSDTNGLTLGEDGDVVLYSNAAGTFIFKSNTDSDLVLLFAGGSNTGRFVWSEDEDCFQFDDGVLIAAAEQICFRDTAIGIYSQADSYLDVFADGAVRIGDSAAGAPTNYTQFDATGHQTMAGTAQPWDDLRIEPVARTTGANAPTFEKWLDDAGGTSRGVYLYSFDDAAAGSEKEVLFTMQMPHSWNGGDIWLHVHWIGDVDDTTAAPRWGLEYAWKDLGQVFGDTTIIYSDGTNYTDTYPDSDIVAKKHYISKFSPISPGATADGISSVLIGRLFRNSSDAADTYDAAGAKCGLLYIDAHYQLNSVGSTDEYTK